MIKMEQYKNLSVRIIDLTSASKVNEGSGILYIAKENAYVFTAAHVVAKKDHEYLIECFHRQDEITGEEDYSFHVKGSQFKSHSGYEDRKKETDFNEKDVAGIKLEKRSWMEKRESLRFIAPRMYSNLAFSGYPTKESDRSIQFAGHSSRSAVKEASEREGRFQFSFLDKGDWSSLKEVIKGFSGSGVYCTDQEGTVPLLMGIFVSGQGKNVSLGTINAVSVDRINQVCLENNWTPPGYYVNQERDGESLISITREDILTDNQTELIKQLSTEVQNKSKQVRTLVRSMRIQNALEVCEELEQSVAYANCTENDKCYFYYLKAHCTLLLKDIPKAETILEEGLQYNVPEKYWILTEKANIAINQGNLSQAEKLLNEAIQLGVADAKAKILKRYIDAVHKKAPLEQKISYVYELSQDAHMDLNGLQTLYSVEGSLCMQDGDITKALDCFKTAYSLQGDKAFLLNQAEIQYMIGMSKSPVVNLAAIAQTEENYTNYLESCDAPLAKAFYQEMGGKYLNCAINLKKYGLVLKHIDGIIAEANEGEKVPMYRMKAIAQLEMDIVDQTVIRQLEPLEQRGFYLHSELKSMMKKYTNLLEEISSYNIDAKAGIKQAETKALKINQELEDVRISLEKKTNKIKQFLLTNKGKTEKALLCLLYEDMINGYLNCKKEKEYQDVMDEFKTLFPELKEEHARNEILLHEAAGEPDRAELLILKYVNQKRTPQRMQEALSYYFRNQKSEEIIELYESLLEDTEGIGQFGRSGLIWAYLDYITKPYSTRLKAMKQYQEYKNELTNGNLRAILEMRFKHHTFDYTEYDKWMEITTYWINETHHEEEYRNAILMAVYNLKQEEAEYYYTDYVNYHFPRMSESQQREQCPSWMWPYFALTEPENDGTSEYHILPEKLERMIQTMRNRNPEEFASWKLLHEMEERTVILDGPFLYYLSKHGLLPTVFRVVEKVLVTYSTINIFLRHQSRCNDPVIENLICWIQSEPRVELGEAGVEKQVDFRGKYGEEGWEIKGTYCLAEERKIPAVGAIQNSEEMMAAMKPYIIWAGDFIEVIGPIIMFSI